MNPDTIWEDPSCRRVLHGLARLGGTRRVRRLQGGTAAVFSGRRHHQPSRHHPEARHDALGSLEITRGSDTLGLAQNAQAAFRMRLACVARQQLWRRPLRSGACVGGQHDTPVLVEEGRSGRERRGQSPLELVARLRGWRPLSRSAPCAIAGPRVHRPGAQRRGLHGWRQARQRRLGLGVARQGRAASVLPRVALWVTGGASRLVDGALCLRLAGCGGDEAPAGRHATGGRRVLVRAGACCAWDHGLAVELGPEGWGFAAGRRHTAHPLHRGLSECLAVGGPREGTLNDPIVRALGGLPRLHRGAHPRANVSRLTAVPAARWQQAREACVRRSTQRSHDVVEVRPRIATIALGDGYARVRGCLVAVVAPIDMAARAIERGTGRRQAETLGGSRRHQTIEGCHPVGRERVHSAPERLIVALRRGNAGRHEARGGLMLEEPRDESARLVDTPSAVEPHRVDRRAHGEVSHGRVLVGGSIHDVPQAECVAQASDKAEGVPHVTAVHGLSGHHHLLAG